MASEGSLVGAYLRFRRHKQLRSDHYNHRHRQCGRMMASKRALLVPVSKTVGMEDNR